ncbi:MAG: UDP-galactopyranose mutase [Clostridiales bacterium]|nr:UDP-galactopyranose mutase [Clostridiales bacterium]
MRQPKRSRTDMARTKKYDYLIVGAGLFGACFAQIMTERGKKCLVVEKRNAVGGNIATETADGITVHKYGAHIFHTSDRRVWEYVNRFAEFNNFVNSPIANYKGKLYNLPFNMFTFYQLWGCKTPSEAREKIEAQRKASGITEPKNLEEKAIMMAGEDVYKTLIKGYTEKQWGRDCKDLPSFIIGRVPLRFTFNNNYFNDDYQGIPKCGYTEMVKNMLRGVEVMTGVDYFDERNRLDALAETTVYTGAIDRFFDYKYGELEYRSLRFETETLDVPDYQGNAVVNYTEYEIPYTRIIEHKHFNNEGGERTIITREYPARFTKGSEPYYPINDEKNTALYAKYAELAKKTKNVLFGGRLAGYKYYDMDDTVAAVFAITDNI